MILRDIDADEDHPSYFLLPRQNWHLEWTRAFCGCDATFKNLVRSKDSGGLEFKKTATMLNPCGAKEQDKRPDHAERRALSRAQQFSKSTWCLYLDQIYGPNSSQQSWTVPKKITTSRWPMGIWISSDSSALGIQSHCDMMKIGGSKITLSSWDCDYPQKVIGSLGVIFGTLEFFTQCWWNLSWWAIPAPKDAPGRKVAAGIFGWRMSGDQVGVEKHGTVLAKSGKNLMY